MMKLLSVLVFVSAPALAHALVPKCDPGQTQVMSCSPFESEANDPAMAEFLGVILICEDPLTKNLIARSIDIEHGDNEDFEVVRQAADGATTYKGVHSGAEISIVRKVISPAYKINGSITANVPGDEGTSALEFSLELACK